MIGTPGRDVTRILEALSWALLVTVMAGALLFVAGLAQSATLHDAAHDTRHATGFPCH